MVALSHCQGTRCISNLNMAYERDVAFGLGLIEVTRDVTICVIANVMAPHLLGILPSSCLKILHSPGRTHLDTMPNPEPSPKHQDFDFWEFVYCAQCHLPFTSEAGGQPQVPFWITECGHVICNNHLSKHIQSTLSYLSTELLNYWRC